jgi:predicted DCC family thiol-disulfide oxidoreductase YuxK
VELLSNRDTERLPPGVSEALIEETIVVRDVQRDRVYTRARAIAVLCRALPLGFVAWAALSLPGLGGAWRALYDVVARNRVRISTALGLAACKLPPRTQDEAAAPH